MADWQIALLIKPFVLFVLCVLVLYPARRYVERKMKDGRLKRLLLLRLSK